VTLSLSLLSLLSLCAYVHAHTQNDSLKSELPQIIF
jgi:hypothetical protein